MITILFTLYFIALTSHAATSIHKKKRGPPSSPRDTQSRPSKQTRPHSVTMRYYSYPVPISCSPGEAVPTGYTGQYPEYETTARALTSRTPCAVLVFISIPRSTWRSARIPPASAQCRSVRRAMDALLCCFLLEVVVAAILVTGI